MLFRGITLSYVLQREGSLATGASFYRGVSCAAGLAYTDILVDTKRSGFARGTTIQWSSTKAIDDRLGPLTHSKRMKPSRA